MWDHLFWGKAGVFEKGLSSFPVCECRDPVSWPSPQGLRHRTAHVAGEPRPAAWELAPH